MTVRWNTPEQEKELLERGMNTLTALERGRAYQWRRKQREKERQMADDFEAAWEWG